MTEINHECMSDFEEAFAGACNFEWDSHGKTYAIRDTHAKFMGFQVAWQASRAALQAAPKQPDLEALREKILALRPMQFDNQKVNAAYLQGHFDARAAQSPVVAPPMSGAFKLQDFRELCFIVARGGKPDELLAYVATHAAPPSAPAVSGWLPIETAPQDTELLLRGTDGYAVGIKGQYGLEASGVYATYDGIGGVAFDIGTITHYMPLPAAPQLPHSADGGG
jgi:hypothetical protein